MTEYGITDQGYRIKPLEVTKTEILESLPLEFGGAPEGSVIGFLIDIMAPHITSLDEQMAEVISMQDPRTAVGTYLDKTTIADRKGATPSMAVLTFTGVPGSVAEKGILTEKDSNARFQTVEKGVINLVQLLPGSGVFSSSDSSFTRDSGDFLTEGISAGTEISISASVLNSGDFVVATVSQSKLTFEETVVDENATPQLDFGRLSVDAICTLNGPTEALAGQIDTIVSSLNQDIHSVVNIEDVSAGSYPEEDVKLRARNRLVLEKNASGTDAAMRADLINLITEVEYARVFSNDNPNLSVSPEGVLPGHTSVVVYPDGTDEYYDKIAKIINYHKAAGQPMQGTVGYTVTESDGKPHYILFNIASEIDVYMQVDIVKTSDYPTDGDDQVLEQILDYAEERVGVGDTVSALDIKVFLKEDPIIPGIKYVDIYMDFIAINTNLLAKDRDLEFSFDQIADIDSSRIVINSTSV